MKKIWAICLFEIKKIFKKPQSYLLMFGMPLLFTLLFGGLMSDSSTEKVKLAFVDEDHSLMSKSLYHSLLKNDLFTVDEMNRNEASKQVKDKKMTGYLEIPKGFEDTINSSNPPVIFKHSPDFTNSSLINQIVSNAIFKIKIDTKASTVWSSYSNKPWYEMYSQLDKKVSSAAPVIQKVSVTKNVKKKEMNNMSARSAGFSIMFVMIMMMTVTGVLLEARKTGVWYRLLAAPVEKLQIMGGYFLSFFLIGWIQFAILMAATSLFFGVQWGDPAGVFVLVSALLLSVIGLGLFIAGFVKTSEQQGALGSIIIASTCMLGGVYWPLDIVPPFMQKMADFIPQTWAMRGFTELIARGGTVMDIIAPVCVLLAFAVTFLAVGISRVRYE